MADDKTTQDGNETSGTESGNDEGALVGVARVIGGGIRQSEQPASGRGRKERRR
jgi:hypothetical protein